MADITKEKIGNVIYDGKIYNVDSMSEEDMQNLQSSIVEDFENVKADLKKKLNI